MSSVQSLKQLFYKRYIRGEVQVFTFAEAIFYEQLLKEEVQCIGERDELWPGMKRYQVVMYRELQVAMLTEGFDMGWTWLMPQLQDRFAKQVAVHMILVLTGAQ